ncbi:MAG: gamma-glutamyl-gamma-aminobutyrate hydrolase family protein [Chloroflexota bacterium]
MQKTTKPFIAVTCGRITNKQHVSAYDLKEVYITSLINAGATPIIIPTGLTTETIAGLADRFDGFLLTGGGDIDPQLFNGGENPNVYGINPERDEFEITLVKYLAKSGKPFFGICRGVQVMNVALGGDLFLDIADEVPAALKHNCFTPTYSPSHLAHTVTVESDSCLAKTLNATSFKTNSLHHQGIKNVGAQLQITAHAEDGIIEGLEMSDHPFAIGVQWHPEWMQADQRMRDLFVGFVIACRLNK